jgi:hypothetical protein
MAFLGCIEIFYFFGLDFEILGRWMARNTVD